MIEIRKMMIQVVMIEYKKIVIIKDSNKEMVMNKSSIDRK